MSYKIIITVRGGVAECISCLPKGVVLIIEDYDIEGVPVEELTFEYDTDGRRTYYKVQIYD